MNTAIIFDIQRNSFVDGPGLRTAVSGTGKRGGDRTVENKPGGFVRGAEFGFEGIKNIDLGRK